MKYRSITALLSINIFIQSFLLVLHGGVLRGEQKAIASKEVMSLKKLKKKVLYVCLDPKFPP